MPERRRPRVRLRAAAGRQEQLPGRQLTAAERHYKTSVGCAYRPHRAARAEHDARCRSRV